jgi:nucleotide-binding universal stress UspA family protein
VTAITAGEAAGAYTQHSGFSLAALYFCREEVAMPTVAQVPRLSLKNILLPTDLSPASCTALPFARTLAEIYGSTILFAHSIPPEPHRQIPTDPLPAQDELIWIPYRTLLERGNVADVISAMIAEQAVDLVVMATHGRRGVSKLIFGSEAEKIYRSATCPVLTVGPKVRDAETWRLRRILCPVDVSEDPKPVLQYALSLAEENQAEFIVLQAIPLVPWQHRELVEMQSRLALENLIPEQAKDWCVPQIVIRWEHPAEAILQASQEREADLIVMSVHKSRALSWSAHLPWPVASEVVGRARCPVLTIRV